MYRLMNSECAGSDHEDSTRVKIIEVFMEVEEDVGYLFAG